MKFPLLSALVLLAACQSANTALPPYGQSQAQARPATPPSVPGAWSFASGQGTSGQGTSGQGTSDQGSCSARVANGTNALHITRLSAGGVRMSASGARGGRLTFTGPDGHFTHRLSNGAVEMASPGAETALQALLGGGVLTLAGSRQPPLRIPPAGVSGREWFGCTALSGVTPR